MYLDKLSFLSKNKAVAKELLAILDEEIQYVYEDVCRTSIASLYDDKNRVYATRRDGELAMLKNIRQTISRVIEG
jgi:hypothetical protein